MISGKWHGVESERGPISFSQPVHAIESYLRPFLANINPCNNTYLYYYNYVLSIVEADIFLAIYIRNE